MLTLVVASPINVDAVELTVDAVALDPLLLNPEVLMSLILVTNPAGLDVVNFVIGSAVLYLLISDSLLLVSEELEILLVVVNIAGAEVVKFIVKPVALDTLPLEPLVLVVILVMEGPVEPAVVEFTVDRAAQDSLVLDPGVLMPLLFVTNVGGADVVKFTTGPAVLDLLTLDLSPLILEEVVILLAFVNPAEPVATEFTVPIASDLLLSDHEVLVSKLVIVKPASEDLVASIVDPGALNSVLLVVVTIAGVDVAVLTVELEVCSSLTLWPSVVDIAQLETTNVPSENVEISVSGLFQ